MRQRISKRTVDALVATDREVRLMDTELRGFGVRARPSRDKSAPPPSDKAARQPGDKSYFIRYRIAGARRYHDIGPHGALTPEKARELAAIALGQVAAGIDPAEERRREEANITVKELCDRYIKDAEAGKVLTRQRRPKKASTLAIDKGRIDQHIVPRLGRKRLHELLPGDIAAFRDAVTAGETAVSKKSAKPRGRIVVTGGAGTAARTLGLLGGIFTYAVRKGLAASNPVQGVEREAGTRRNRSPKADEYRAIGLALDELDAEGVNQRALLSIRLVALTGLRRQEALSLTPSACDLGANALRFQDTKTGVQTRPIGDAACDVLRRALKLSSKEWVFPAAKGDGYAVGVSRIVDKVMERAGVQDITLHVLRHGFASVAAELGYSENTIGGLLGHRSGSITSRYIHLADPVLVAAATRVAAVIDARMRGIGAQIVSIEQAQTG